MSAQPDYDDETTGANLTYVPGGSYTPLGTEQDGRTASGAPIPAFEGNKVHRTKAQFTSTSNLEVEDEVYRLDEVRRFYVEAKVIDVRHKVNEKTGELDRVQILKVVDVQPVTWDSPKTWKE